MRGVCVLMLALLGLGGSGVSAQDFWDAIAGRISDASGGRLPGVTVTVTNTATNIGSASGSARSSTWSC